MTRPPPVLIGWTEYVELPDWGIRGLRAKVDTGARTSALHVEDIEVLPRDRVAFDVVLNRKVRSRRVRVRTRIVRRGRVRSSSGHRTLRIFVRARVRIGPVERDVEVSLVDREKMIHRMLLGRTALAGAFLIDVNKRNLATAPPRRKKKGRKKRVSVGRRDG